MTVTGRKYCKFTINDKRLSERLQGSKKKKAYRQYANELLDELHLYLVVYSHVDTGEMQDHWKIAPLKYHDSQYKVFGEVYNESDHAYYERRRGGDHDTVRVARSAMEADFGVTIRKMLKEMMP